MSISSAPVRRTEHEGFAAAWPSMTDDSGFAEKMNSMPKYVVSSTLGDLQWSNSTLIEGDLATEVAKLTQQPGQDILVAGSRTLAQALMADGLVDEHRLMVFPIVLGSGKRLFSDYGQLAVLTLTGCQRLDSGTLILTCVPSAADAADAASAA